MKTIVAALASASLLVVAATPAAAQSHGSHGSGGHAGSFHSGGFHGGGFRSGGHFRGGFRGGPFFGGFGLGLALGAFADPWYGYPGYYGYYGYYPSYWADEYDPGPYDDADGPPPPRYQSHPQASAPSAACGSWTWDAARSRYNWTPC